MLITVNSTLIGLGFSVLGTVVGHVISYMFASIIGATIIYLEHYRKYKNSHFSGSEDGFSSSLKTMISYGSPLHLSSLFAINVMIGNFSVMLNFIALMLILINPISTALFPAFSKLNPSGYEVRRMFR